MDKSLYQQPKYETAQASPRGTSLLGSRERSERIRCRWEAEPVSQQRVSIELNPSERRLYDRLREYLVAHEPSQASGLRDLLLFLPDLGVLLVRLLRDPEVPGPRKWIAALGLGYLLSPLDLLPGLLFGPLGLVDDLLILSATLSHLLNHVHPDRVRAHWSGQGDVLQVLQRVSAWCESVFRHRLREFLPDFFRPRGRSALS